MRAVVFSVGVALAVAGCGSVDDTPTAVDSSPQAKQSVTPVSSPTSRNSPRTKARAAAAANLAESRLLAATNWPASVVQAVKDLIRANAEARRHWGQGRERRQPDRNGGRVAAGVAASGKQPAAQIRSRLGLPKYDEKDYS